MSHRRTREEHRRERERRAPKWAEAVNAVIPVGGISDAIMRVDIRAQTGLTNRQIQYAVVYLRDHDGPDRVPLLSGPWGYVRSLEAAPTVVYQNVTMHQSLVMLRRGHAVLQGYLQRVPADQARAINKAWSRLIEDMRDAPVISA
jgi:hypothetical protein